MSNSKPAKPNQGFSTKILHAQLQQRAEHGAFRESIQPSLAFNYEKVEGLIAAFQGNSSSFTYARNSSPTVESLEKQISIMENAKKTLCFATGMAAIAATMLTLLKQGDHLLSSTHIFGNTKSFIDTLQNLGIQHDFISFDSVDTVKAALRPNTKMVFFETLSNPNVFIPDIENIANLLAEKKIISLVDNTLSTPYLFQPKDYGFTFSHHSLSKYIGGHSAALGGSLSDFGNYNWKDEQNIFKPYRQKHPDNAGLHQIQKKGIRDMGSTLSPFNAALLSIGAETLVLRLQEHIRNALILAEFLEQHPKVKHVYFPGLPSHPHHERMKKYFTQPSGLLSFELKTGLDVLAFMNGLQTICRSTHLADTRTLAIPIAKTIYHEMGQEKRAAMGIAENQIRLSAGIENSEDLIYDLDQALHAI